MLQDLQSSRATPALLDALNARFGSDFSQAQSVRDQHSQTFGPLSVRAPDGVVVVRSREDVVDAVNLCADADCPIIAYGTGTSVEGQVSAEEGGVTLDFSGMDQIIEINPEDFDCRVQPGVTRERLNQELRDLGLFFPVDPGANASLGGMAGTAASGTTTVRYGAMRQHVMGLEVVLATGEIIRTGGRSRKSAAGYDLTQLLVGSEGTLGLTTELTLRLHPIPQAIAVATCAFPSVGDCVRAATEIMQHGLPVARIELVDRASIKALNAYRGLGMDDGDYLFLEARGSESSVRDDLATIEEIVGRHSVIAFEKATAQDDINRIWRARHDAALAGLAMTPNSAALVTDICVPISRLDDCIEGARADIQDAGLVALIGGHVGDGNFHVGFVLPRDDEDAFGRAHQVHDAMVRRALSMKGTCTGEHGIGIGKKDYLRLEHAGGWT